MEQNQNEKNLQNVGAHNPVGKHKIAGITSDEEMKSTKKSGGIPGITIGLMPDNAKPHYLIINPQRGLSQQQWDMMASSGKVHIFTLKDESTVTGTVRMVAPQKPGELPKNMLLTGGKEMEVNEPWMREVANVEELGMQGDGKSTTENATKETGFYPLGLTEAQFDILEEKAMKYNFTMADGSIQQGQAETDIKKKFGKTTTVCLVDGAEIDLSKIREVELAD